MEEPWTTRFSFRRLATRTVMRASPSPPGPPPSWVGNGARVVVEVVVVGWAEPDTPLVRLALSPPEAPSLLRSPSVLRILNPHPPSPPDSSPHRVWFLF